MYRQTLLFRFQYVLALATLGVTALYFALYRPWSDRANKLDGTLQSTWTRLLDLNLKNHAQLGMDTNTVSDNFKLAEKGVNAAQKSSQQVRERIQFSPEVRDKLRQTFQLLDYEQERLLRIDQLRSLAAAKKARLEPAVTGGFPEYTQAKDNPALLYLQLALVHRILTNALASGAGAIQSISLLPPKMHAVGDNNQILFEEFPARVQLTGPTESILAFLSSLSGKIGDTTNGVGSASPKPALFIDRLILKSATNQPNDLSLEVVISGFLNQEDLPSP